MNNMLCSFLLLKGSSGQSKNEDVKCQQNTNKLLLCSNVKAKLEWREEGMNKRGNEIFIPELTGLMNHWANESQVLAPYAN
jgi:hypothetical protein